MNAASGVSHNNNHKHSTVTCICSENSLNWLAKEAFVCFLQKLGLKFNYGEVKQEYSFFFVKAAVCYIDQPFWNITFQDRDLCDGITIQKVILVEHLSGPQERLST